MQRQLIVLVAVGCVVAVAPAPARADEATEQARKLNDAGDIHYNAGEYQLAIASYEKAYEKKAVPLLLYNIAQAYRLWGKPAEAADYYRKYLALVVEGPYAEAARGHLPQLDELAEEQRRRENEHKTPPPPPDREIEKPAPPSRRGMNRVRLTSYVVAGLGVAALATGIGFGIHASNLEQEVSEVDNWTQENIDKIDQGQRAELLSIVFSSTGAVLIGTGVVLFLTSRGDAAQEQPLAVTPVVGDRRVGLSLSGRF